MSNCPITGNFRVCRGISGSEDTPVIRVYLKCWVYPNIRQYPILLDTQYQMIFKTEMGWVEKRSKCRVAGGYLCVRIFLWICVCVCVCVSLYLCWGVSMRVCVCAYVSFYLCTCVLKLVSSVFLPLLCIVCQTRRIVGCNWSWLSWRWYNHKKEVFKMGGIGIKGAFNF